MEVTSAEITVNATNGIQKLEKRRNWSGRSLINLDGVWYPERCIQPVLSFQKHFKPKKTDIILATLPKSGTTWLKALMFAIINRHRYPVDQSPLLTSNPHQLVPFLEFDTYLENDNPDLENLPSPRIFGTHMPYQVLPDSVLESGSRIIYICRNPLDVFVSLFHFLNVIKEEGIDLPSFDEAFDMFCNGIHSFGPFWEHMEGYWNAHLKNSDKVLFLRYEDLKGDGVACVKKIAEFVGFPFTDDEVNRGVVDEIVSLCSFENLKGLEVNKTGKKPGMPATSSYVRKKAVGDWANYLTPNSSYFRKGAVGDWENYLTPSMAERLEMVMEMKLGGSGVMTRLKGSTIGRASE